MSSLGKEIGTATSDVLTCTIVDDVFRDHVPKEHIGQVIHQMVVLKSNVFLYLSASEIWIIYIVVAKFPYNILQDMNQSSIREAKEAVSWASGDDLQVPLFADCTSCNDIEELLPFWLTIDPHVKQKGPFPPLKIFKHGSQIIYSKTKGGLDGSTQARSILYWPTLSLQWKQKLVSQILNTLNVNAFISWRISEKEDLLVSKDAFGSLESYLDILNHVQPLADFISDSSQELLTYAVNL